MKAIAMNMCQLNTVNVTEDIEKVDTKVAMEYIVLCVVNLLICR